MADLMFGMKLLLTFILFLLKILRNLWSLEKCLSIRFRKYLPIFVATSLPKGGLNQIIFLFRCFFVLGLLLLLYYYYYYYHYCHYWY